MTSRDNFDEFIKKLEKIIEEKVEKAVKRALEKAEIEIERKEMKKAEYPPIYIDVNKIVSRVMETVSKTMDEVAKRLSEIGREIRRQEHRITKIIQTPLTKVIKIVETPSGPPPSKQKEKVKIIRFDEERTIDTQKIMSEIRQEIENALKKELKKSLEEVTIYAPEEKPSSEMLDYAAEIFDVLANRERLRLLFLLEERDRYFVELKELLKLSPSSLRLHLTKLMSLGLVSQEKARGKYYITEKGKHLLAFLKQFLADFKRYMEEEGSEA